MDTSPNIAIIGGGLLGSSLFYHLSTHPSIGNQRVLLIEKSTIANKNGATANSLNWINSHQKDPKEYHQLNTKGTEYWKKLLTREFNQKIPFNWTGSVEVAIREDEFNQQMQRYKNLGYVAKKANLEDLSAERQVFLHKKDEKSPLAILCENEATVDSVKACHEFVKAAQKNPRFSILENSNVTAIQKIKDTQRNLLPMIKITLENQKELLVGKIIIAAGTESSKLCSYLGYQLPLLERPGTLAVSKPIPKLSLHYSLFLMPTCHFKQDFNGRIVAGLDMHGEGPVIDSPQEIEHKIFNNVKQYLGRNVNLELEEVRRGFRPFPLDGKPVIGFIDGRDRSIYLTVMHSGVTLGPYVGFLAAREILDGLDNQELNNYRLTRFKSQNAKF